MEKLKKLVKDNEYEAIIAYVLSIENLSILEQMISFLKKKEVFINRYTDADFSQYIESLKKGNTLITFYAAELECINLIFAEEKKMQGSIRAVRKKERLSDLLCCLDGVYSHFYQKHKDLKSSENDIQDPGIFLDGLAALYNSTFKSLLYDNEIWQKEAFKYSAFRLSWDASSINICNKYILFSAMSHTWDVLFENWKNGLITIARQGNKIVTRYIETSYLIWLRKSKSKLQIYEYIKDIELAEAVKVHPAFFSNELTDYYEILAWGTVKSYLHTDNIYTLIDDVPIIYWIRAYAALIRYAQRVNFINSFRGFFLIRALLGKCLLVRHRNEWVDLFIQVDIPEESANKIFNRLTYNKKSSDLYDFPFVKTKNKYMVIPALLNVAHAGKLLKSRFRQNDFNISQKGKLFEKEIISMLEKHNVPVVQLHRRHKGQDYECDIIFLLDDTLFLCECKDNGDKYLYDYVADFYKNDITQMERISEFFEAHSDMIVDEFKKSGMQNVRFKKIQKFLIYNTVFHSILKIKDIHVVDYERFIAVFRRGDLDKYICRLYGGPLDCLFGKITVEKMIRYLNSEFRVCEYDEIIKLTVERLPFGSLIIENQVERCTSIDREKILAIISPWYAGPEEFFDNHK